MTTSTNSPSEAQAQLQITPRGDVQAALDEINRERMVRDRCFPRWIGEGKISKMDAEARLERIKLAEKILQLLLDSKLED
jgi:hypothetical protein